MLNEFRTQKLSWDKAHAHIHQVVSANGGDANGRKLQVQIVNNGVVEDLTGASVSLAWKTKNGANFGLDAFEAIDATKGIFEIYYTTEMLTNEGVLRASLVLIDDVGRVESNAFALTVYKSNVDDDAVQGENSFTALTQALVSVNNLEENYAPQLQAVTAQLAQKATKAALLQTNTELSGVDQRIDNLVIPISAENANLEVTDAHVSIVKGKTFDSLSKRFRESEEEIGYLERFNGMVENVVKDEWTAAGGTLSSESGTLTLSGAGNTSNVHIRQQLGRAGRKFYFKASVRALSDRTNGIELLYGSDRISVKFGPAVDEWYDIEGVYDITTPNNLFVKHLPIGSGAILADEQIQVKDVMGLDLTSIFGSGNEPDLVGAKSFINDLGVEHFEGKISQYNLKDIAEHAEDVPRLTESVDFFLDNKIRNGAFQKVTASGNFDYWANTAGSTTNEWTSTSDGAKITLNSAGSPLILSQGGDVLAEHVYYVSGEIKSTIPFSASSDTFIYMQNTSGQMTLGDVTDEFVRKSGIRIAPYSTSAYFMTLSAGNNQPVDSSVYFNNIMAIDLTEIFGAGNEPSLEEMDSLYDMIGWFEGAKTVSQSVMVKWLTRLRETPQQQGTLVPQYVTEDITAINDTLVYDYGSHFNIAFMTDVHDKEEHYKYATKLMNYGHLNGLVVNGDLGKSSNESSLANTKAYFLEHTQNLKDISQGVYFTRGNHDGVADATFTDEHFTNAVIRAFVKDNVEDKGYYYVDHPEYNLRLIFLNSSMDSLSRMGFDTTQIAWLTQTLADVPDDYDVITFSHHHLIDTLDSKPVATNSEQVLSAIQDFKTNNPNNKHVGHFFGHNHQDRLEEIDGITHVSTVASNGSPSSNRINGTNTEYAIDLISVDKKTQTVNLLRMGYGDDRSFTY